MRDRGEDKGTRERERKRMSQSKRFYPKITRLCRMSKMDSGARGGTKEVYKEYLFVRNNYSTPESTRKQRKKEIKETNNKNMPTNAVLRAGYRKGREGGRESVCVEKEYYLSGFFPLLAMVLADYSAKDCSVAAPRAEA